MPLGSSSPVLASGYWRRVMVMLLFVVLLWEEPEMGGGVAAPSPPNKLEVAPDLGTVAFNPHLLSHHGGEKGVEVGFVAALLDPRAVQGRFVPGVVSPASGDSAGLRLHWVLSPLPMKSTEHWWLSTCCIAPNPPRVADASSDSHEMQDNILQILVDCNSMSGSRSCDFYLLIKDWTSICTTPWYATVYPFTSNRFKIRLAAIGSPTFLLLQAWYMVVWNEKQRTTMDLIVLKIRFEKMNCKILTQPSNITVKCGPLPIAQTQHKYEKSGKFNSAAHTRLLLHIYWCAEANLEKGNTSKHDQDCMFSSRCPKFFMADDHPVEDTAPLFGFFHQRCTTTPLSLIPRFNRRGPSRLSSVMVLKNLQLSSLKPPMHTPDRPLGEPPTGHQLVWSINEALEDCRCSNIESVLSADKRSLFGFICSLQYHLLVFRSSLCYFVLLGTCILCLALHCHVVILYPDL